MAAAPRVSIELDSAWLQLTESTAFGPLHALSPQTELDRFTDLLLPID